MQSHVPSAVSASCQYTGRHKSRGGGGFTGLCTDPDGQLAARDAGCHEELWMWLTGPQTSRTRLGQLLLVPRLVWTSWASPWSQVLELVPELGPVPGHRLGFSRDSGIYINPRDVHGKSRTVGWYRYMTVEKHRPKP